MAQLSSHPLPASALRAAVLQRIYERTPPTPRAARTQAETARTQAETAPIPTPSGTRVMSIGASSVPPELLSTPVGTRARRLTEQYELLEYLDSGGTADVFVALDHASGERVAVKILNEKSRSDELLRGYFLAGARGALRIRHPHVVRADAVIEPADAPAFAVMEIIAGKPLSSLLADHGALEPSVVAELSIQVAAGLDAAHRAGVVHCDVKPENLLVWQDSAGRLALKIIDFDLAALDGEDDPHEHPKLRGTAKYMSPEQVVGDRVDARTDVYSLGVVMFRMLTGHLPFELELCTTLLWHQLVSKAPPPSWLCDELDPGFEAIVLKALRKDPENRYGSMGLMLADLHAWHAGEALLAERPLPKPDDIYEPRRSGAQEAASAIVHSVQRRAPRPASGESEL